MRPLPNELRPGMDLVVTKWIAMEGTLRILEEKKEELQKRFRKSYLAEIEQLEQELVTDKEYQAAEKFGACLVHPLGEGGILDALWEVAEGAGVGLFIDTKEIPIRQETIELCEVCDMNPYYFLSKGALLIGCRKGADLVRKLKEEGIPAAVIGQTEKGNDRILWNGEHTRYLDRPQKDESRKLVK